MRIARKIQVSVCSICGGVPEYYVGDRYYCKKHLPKDCYIQRDAPLVTEVGASGKFPEYQKLYDEQKFDSWAESRSKKVTMTQEEYKKFRTLLEVFGSNFIVRKTGQFLIGEYDGHWLGFDPKTEELVCEFTDNTCIKILRYLPKEDTKKY